MSGLFNEASLVLVPSGYKSGKVYSEVPTNGDGDLSFTRSNDTATRVNSAGLIEKVRTNLVPNGLLFNGSTGVLYTTIPSDSPISGLSSMRITKNEAAGTLRYGQQTISASVLNGSISYTISAYFKYDGYNTTTSLEFNNSYQFGGTGWIQNIDIASTGVTLQAPSNCTSKVTNVGNGWYRVEVTFVNGASPSGSPVTGLLKVASTLSTGEGFLTAAPQFETGDIATEYIPTTSAAVSVGMLANVPRLDYSGGGCPKLLLEPQRTNLVTYSEQFDNAYWTKFNATITSNATTSPNGTLTADKLVENSVNGNHFIYRSQATFTPSASYFQSWYVKAGERYKVRIQDASDGTFFAAYNLNTGSLIDEGTNTIGNTNITPLLNGWYRLTLLLNQATSAKYAAIILLPDSYTAGDSITYQGDGTSGVYIWGAQLELGSYATSYIPATSTAVTRTQDSASKTGISSLIGQTEGTLYYEGVVSANAEVCNLNRSTINAVFIYTRSTGEIAAYVYADSNGINLLSTVQASSRFKCAIAYKSNSIAFYVNGNLIAENTTATFTPNITLDRFDIGYGGYVSSANAQTLNQALLFKTRLSNAQLASLTTL
ncbi:MAG TPA: hypothetical protein VMW53_09955 [archaeon]|nr:hypothetical protein [archaeon]